VADKSVSEKRIPSQRYTKEYLLLVGIIEPAMGFLPADWVDGG